MPKLNALVAGSTGYIGTQLIKILVKHKYIKIKYLCGNSSVGKTISSYEKSLSKYKLPKIKKFNKNLLDDVDIIFTALPNGCLLYTSPSPRDATLARMPSSA